MEEMKSKLENEDLIKVLKFCKENNVEMNFNWGGSGDAVNMKKYYGHAIYSQMFSKDDIKASDANVAEMFLEKANNELHSVPDPDPDIYNYSEETKIVCRGILFEDNRYKYVVMSAGGYHPCVYIKFPGIENIMSYNDIVSPDVHGGFTFLGELTSLPEEGVWLGWDYAHWGDYTPAGFSFRMPILGEEHAWTKKELTDAAVAALTQIRDIGLVLNMTIGRAE